MRSLTECEQTRLKFLIKHEVSFTLMEPTQTGLNKSIMDATGSVRNYFKGANVHDYELQNQGAANKVQITAYLYDAFGVFNSTASLYRPNTKKGDPRIWFSSLPRVANPNDIVVIIFHSDAFHVFSLTQLEIESIFDSFLNHPLKELILDVSKQARETATELLSKLRAIANQGPIPSMIDADTSVGRTLETALGIAINSSKKPDYKGIEIKSFRGKRKNRKNLFAQVPNWELSKLKGSAEILDEFGYQRGVDFKLYCTVSTISKNSQGLYLKLETHAGYLSECSDKTGFEDFVVWNLDVLHARLREKHRETFWIEADSIFEDGKEFFQYSVVEHTKRPIVSQFDILVGQGIITLDHLIKRDSNGRVVEKGPLFKIKTEGLDLLFPPSEKYHLIA